MCGLLAVSQIDQFMLCLASMNRELVKKKTTK